MLSKQFFTEFHILRCSINTGANYKVKYIQTRTAPRVLITFIIIDSCTDRKPVSIYRYIGCLSLRSLGILILGQIYIFNFWDSFSMAICVSKLMYSMLYYISPLLLKAAFFTNRLSTVVPCCTADVVVLLRMWLECITSVTECIFSQLAHRSTKSLFGRHYCIKLTNSLFFMRYSRYYL